MAAIIVAFDADGLRRWDYRAVVEHVSTFGTFVDHCRFPFRPEAAPGTDAWLLLCASGDSGSGLIGHGLVVSEPYAVASPGSSGGPACFTTAVAFDALLPVGEQIGPSLLKAVLPDEILAGVAGQSLVTVPASSEPTLRRLWRDHGPTTPDPAGLPGGTLPPDAVRTIQVNRYEQDPDARRMCLAFHGTSCAACGFSFEATYGEAATSGIAVHHLVPPEMLGTGYQLDPVADLVPLCRNCHAVAHSADPPRTVSELRHIMSGSGHLKGQVVNSQQLQAQEDARRIVEGGPA